MIEIAEISPSNEMPIARKLEASILAMWPDLRSNVDDKVVIAVGLHTLREIDLLVLVDLARPRQIPSIRRRDGSMSPVETMQAAALIIEVKQLDASRLTIVGTEVFPDYGKGAKRSVDQQIGDCCIALAHHRDRYDIEECYLHGIGWLAEVSEAALAGVNPWILGSEAGWPQILDAAAQRSTALYGAKSVGYRNAVATLTDTLTRKRPVTPRDRETSNSLCNDVLVDEVIDDLASRAGRMQIRLTGRGGSGKTTTLALLAKRLAQRDEARVLILTFHKTLRSDIEHLVGSIVDEPAIRARIGVETTNAFLVSALSELGIALPVNAGGFDFQQLPAVISRVLATMDRDPNSGDAAFLREVNPKRFAWDYVFIDEAQDWSDAERDFVRALYGVRNIVLADGLEQLVQRQTACDWAEGIPKDLRHNRHLGRSLRMTRNVAAFANAVAREAGLVDWKIEPYEKLAGGRVVVAVGGDVDTVALVQALEVELSAANARPIDALLCVPPVEVHSAADGSRHAARAAALEAAGISNWDASNLRIRDEEPSGADAWRIVQYHSCRGLEGWATVAFGLDQLLANKHKYPNLAAGESDTPENVVRRWLMIAITRAVHTLVITVADSNAPVVALLHGAADRLPKGVVEWTTGPECPAIVRATFATSQLPAP